MPDSDWSESTILAEWAERECRHIDLITSWEMLLSLYDALEFKGPENDDMRLAEFKTIVSEFNKSLTRMKTGLSKTTGIESAVAFLESHINTKDMSEVRTRPAVAYNKLKQRWISLAVATLTAAAQQTKSDEGEGEDER